MDNLTAVHDWAGTAPDVRTTLASALGGPTLIRDVVFVGRGAWDAVVATLNRTKPSDADPAVEVDRDLSPLDHARLEMFRRVCLLRAGAQPDTPGAALAGPILPAGGGPQPAGAVAGGRKLKLSAVIEQSLDAEVVSMTQSEIQTLFERYCQTYGDPPSTEAEPTGDQISGLKQLVSSGSTPYVDFAVFGPHGLRILRRLTFQASYLNSSGEWTKRELPGPPDFEAWFAIFRCMRTAFLLLETCTAERLDSYCEHVRALHSRFGRECWDFTKRTFACAARSSRGSGGASSRIRSTASRRPTLGMRCSPKR